MKYLMTFSKYYYSEFGVDGFSVIETPQDLDEISNTIENYENPIEIYFGTNQSFEFDNGKDIWNYIGVRILTNEEAIIIKDLFGESYGTLTPIDIFDTIIDEMIEDAEENEEED